MMPETWGRTSDTAIGIGAAGKLGGQRHRLFLDDDKPTTGGGNFGCCCWPHADREGPRATG